MKWLKSITVIVALLFSVSAYGVTVTKGLIGAQDIHQADGTTTRTFTRPSSTGGTLTLNDVGYEVDALISYGGGVNYTQATIEAALTAIGTVNKVTLLLRPGTWGISSNADWSAYTNVTFKIVPGALLQIATGTTTTIGGPVDIGLHQAFNCVGTGTVVLKTFTEVLAEWFGANADWNGTTGTNNTTPTQKAISSLSTRGGTVRFSVGVYYFATHVQMANSISIRGAGYGDLSPTVFIAATRMFNLSGQTEVNFSDFEVYGTTAQSGSAFYLPSGTNARIEISRVWVQNKDHAIHIGASATVVTFAVNMSNFIYNASTHVLIENLATIVGLSFTDVKFDAQNNTLLAGHVKFDGPVGKTVFTRCLFQSSSSLYAVWTAGNVSMSFHDSMFYNNANDSQGIITDGANVKLGPGNAVVEFKGCSLLSPKSTAVNFYHILISGTGTMDLAVIVDSCLVALIDTSGLLAVDPLKPANITVSNTKFTPPAASPYDALSTAGTHARRANNYKDASGYLILNNIVSTVSTTDATVTTIQGGVYSVQPSTNYLISYDVMGKNSDSSVYGAYHKQEFITVAADRTITIVGSLYADQLESDAGLDAGLVAVASAGVTAGLKLCVTGKAATNMDWVAEVKVIALGNGTFPL